MMKTGCPDACLSTASRRNAAGSALVMAVFVLFLVANLAIALLFLTHKEEQLSQADGRTKRVFYIAEAGLEDARRTLFLTNGEGPFNDDLIAAAGPDLNIDFDLATLEPTFDGAGNVTGFNGVGDDQPLAPITAFGDGIYAAYLTNDPAEGRTVKNDANDRVMLTGIGVGADRSVEVVQAIVQPKRPFPLTPQAAITLLGPAPTFASGSSDPSAFQGNDCGQGGGLFVPTVGAIGPAAEASVESGIFSPNGPDFSSGTYSGTDTVVDLTNTTDTLMVDANMDALPTEWQDCELMHDLVDELQSKADHTSLQPSYNPGDITFVDGDLSVDANDGGNGTLVVTGTLTIDGNADWDGLILVIGKGRIVRNGGGSGNLSGAIVVADVAGPDNILGNADDCQNGFESPDFIVNGNGNSNVEFCSTALLSANPLEAYRIEEFVQR